MSANGSLRGPAYRLKNPGKYLATKALSAQVVSYVLPMALEDCDVDLQVGRQPPMMLTEVSILE